MGWNFHLWLDDTFCAVLVYYHNEYLNKRFDDTDKF